MPKLADDFLPLYSDEYETQLLIWRERFISSLSALVFLVTVMIYPVQDSSVGKCDHLPDKKTILGSIG